jgi:hypothetical protein
MPRDFTPAGIAISAGIAKCANHCRFCQLDYRRPESFSVERFVAVVDKFVEYKAKTGFEVGQWLGYSFDLSLEDFDRQLKLYARTGWPLKVILMGGMPFMKEETLAEWYRQRQAIGSDTVVASYYGFGGLHDYLNNKTGHFEYQLKSQKIAASLGMNNSQRIFLFKSALKDMGSLLDRLDEVENVTERIAYPLFYSGLGKKFEDERLTKDDMVSGPERLKQFYREDKNEWKSEKEWVEWVADGKPTFPQNWLTLVLTDENIEQIEKMGCEEIIEDLTVRTRKMYNLVPSKEELAEKYSDKTNEKIYMFMWDMECLWVDRFLERNPHVSLNERCLTHFGR